MLEVHGVLTAKRRAVLAERIAEHGPRGMMGKGGKHRSKGRHRGRRSGKRGGRHSDQDGGPEFG